MSYALPFKWSSTIRYLWRDHSRRVVGLDLLRAAAVISVVLGHYSNDKPFPIPFNHYGWTGVDLFFVLSGYLIGGQLFSLQLKNRSIPLKTFYMRRFMRTLPNYYVVLAIYMFVSPLSPLTTLKERLLYFWSYVTFMQNLTLVLPFFQVSWSLCVEEHFYLFLPPLIYLCLKRKGQWIGWIFPLVILSEIVLRAVILLYGLQNLRLVNEGDVLAYMGRIYFPTYCRLDGLTIGVALAAMQHYQPRLWSKLLAHGNRLLWAGGAGLCLAFILMSSKLYTFTGIVVFSMLGISFGLLTASALSPQCILSRVKSRAITILAELAYSIYLTHLLGFYVADALLKRCGLTGYNAPTFIFTALAVFGTALTLFALVERPCLRLRDRLFAYQPQPAPGINPLAEQYNLPASLPARQ